MAKNNNNYNKSKKNKQQPKQKVYQNPANRAWGKIIIAILAVAMCLGGLASLIYLIVQSILH